MKSYIRTLTLVCLAIFAGLSAAAAPATESIKFSWSKLNELRAALGSLDGHQTVVDQGKDADGKAKAAIVVPLPYDFSPATRRAIAHDQAAILEAFKAIEDTRQADLQKVSPGASEKVAADPALTAKFTDLFSKHDSLDVKIERLSEDELSANPLPPSTLLLLAPILAPSK